MGKFTIIRAHRLTVSILSVLVLWTVLSPRVWAQSATAGSVFVGSGGQLVIADSHSFLNNAGIITSGMIGTERTAPQGLISFLPGATWTGASDNAFVDGYVRKYGTGLFVFPVGDNGVYRPIQISGGSTQESFTSVAYFGANPGVAVTSSLAGFDYGPLPTGAPFAPATKQALLATISSNEYWDIDGTEATIVSLSYAASSGVSTLTGSNLDKLTLVGWHIANAQWEEIPSLVDETAFLGGLSNLTTGSVSSTSAIVPNTYAVITLGGLVNARIVDSDGDGVSDNIDVDDDNDGILDTVENNSGCGTSISSLGTDADCDGDGVPNRLDSDSDGDGIFDVAEAGGSDPDNDGKIGTGIPSIATNGLPTLAGSGLTPPNTDSDGSSNPFDTDSDGDGVLDSSDNCPTTAGTSANGGCPGGVRVAAKVYLQGALYGVPSTSSLMRDDLRVKGFLPTSNPYAAMGWTSLTSVGTVNTSVFQVTGNDAIVDWVYLELRSSSDPTQVVDSKAALLQRDGDIVETDGISPVLFTQVGPGSYHVAIRHRNHLGILSANPMTLSTTATSVDFRLNANVAYKRTTTATDQAQVVVNQGYAMWSGNVVVDDKVVYQGTNNDVENIYQTIINASGNSTFQIPTYKLNGYFRTDINMDGVTLFAGSGNDTEFIYMNIITNHPGNTLRTSIFSISEQKP